MKTHEQDILKIMRNASDPKRESIRFLFELAVFYALLVVVALAASTGAGYLLDATLPDMTKRDAWVLGLSCALFLIVLIGINISFDGTAGKYRKHRIEWLARRYGYPIVLSLGLLAGWHYHAYSQRHSLENDAEYAVLAACNNLPHCMILAKRINGGNDVEQYRRTK